MITKLRQIWRLSVIGDNIGFIDLVSLFILVCIVKINEK